MSAKERVGFLDILSPAVRRELMAFARVQRVLKDKMVLATGQTSSDVFIVQEGRLQVVLYAASGREVLLRDLGPGQLFGELAALEGEPRSVSIMAATDARLLVIGQEAFRAAVLSQAEAADWMLRRLSAQIRSLTDRVFELSALNVQARLHCELMRLARSTAGEGGGLEPAPTHAELASRIGTHREAVTRELKVLADRNIIRAGRRRLEFLDLERLEMVVSASLRAPVGEAGWW